MLTYFVKISVSLCVVTRSVCCAAILLLAVGPTVRAQRDTLRRSAITDSAAAADSATGPRTIREAEADGLELLGIYDNVDGHWIQGATVRDTLGDEVATSRIGVVALNALVPIAGYYLIEIRKAGYSPRWLRLRADTASETMIALAPNPLGGVMLAPTVVTAERKLATDAGQREGFIYRCQTGLISCIGRRVLDLHPAGNLDAFLSHVDGVDHVCYARHDAQLNPTPQPAARWGCKIEMKSLAGEGCTPDYVVNGFDWDPLGDDAQAELDQFLNATTISGIEVYLPGHPVPKRFDPAPFSSCGVIVIWTR